MTVPVRVALNAPSLGELERQYVNEALASGWITTGPFCERLEEAFARYVGRRHGVLCASGTAALWLALSALERSEGPLIVPTYTCDAILNAAHFAGRSPLVAIDAESQTWGPLGQDIVARLIADPLPAAVIVAHCYGVIARDTALVEAHCQSLGVPMIEDASEAHGAAVAARRAGHFGTASVFSFRGEKTLGGGQLGIAVTDDADLARRARQVAHCGLPCHEVRFWSSMPAFNAQPSHLNAALACAQLERINELVKARNAVHERWVALLGGIEGLTFQVAHGEPAWWLTGVLVDAAFTSLLPQDIMIGLRAVGIETRPGFYPLHSLPHFVGVGPQGGGESFSMHLLRRLLILPSGPTVTAEQQAYVVRELFRLVGRAQWAS